MYDKTHLAYRHGGMDQWMRATGEMIDFLEGLSTTPSDGVSAAKEVS